jgi:hypothetical protein
MHEEEFTMSEPPTVRAEELVLRSQNLLGELEELEDFLTSKNRRESELGSVELRQFKNSITAESKSLQKVCYCRFRCICSADLV